MQQLTLCIVSAYEFAYHLLTESCFMVNDNDDKKAFADEDVLQDSLMY